MCRLSVLESGNGRSLPVGVNGKGRGLSGRTPGLCAPSLATTKSHACNDES